MALAVRSVCDVGSPEWLRRYVFANRHRKILSLNVGGGTLTEIAESELGFEHSLAERAKREVWFAEQQLAAFAECGLKPNDLQCIGFKTPVVFAESRSVPDNAYVADLYEQVSFLGDLHRQISDVPNGGKVRLRVASRPSDPQLARNRDFNQNTITFKST